MSLEVTSSQHLLSTTKIGLCDLPDDVLLKIFSTLDAISLRKVRRVCQRFCQLSSDEILWKHKLLEDIHTWKQITGDSLPREVGDSNIDNQELYLRAAPEIVKWKKQHYENTTLHQMTSFLKRFMPTKRYLFGVEAEAMDIHCQGKSVIERLLVFDTANPFQHCGIFPGKFRGQGGGFQFKYKGSILELTMMYVAPRSERMTLSLEGKINRMAQKLEDQGHKELYAAVNGYVLTVDSRIADSLTVADLEKKMLVQYEELVLIDKCLQPEVPLLILSCKQKESDNNLPSYKVSSLLQLQNLKRPWMVSECSAQMLYTDLKVPFDWLISNAKPY